MTEPDFRKFLRGTGKGFMDFGIWFQVKKIYKKKNKKKIIPIPKNTNQELC